MDRVGLSYVLMHDFRSFKGDHRIDFPPQGMMNLRGENRDARTDSGAGKTNATLALSYVFKHCPFPARALQCWDSEDPFFVEVGLTSGDVIRRGPSGLTVNDLKGTAAEDELDRICGVDPKLRELLTYKRQVDPKRFLDLEDKQLKDLLVRVLGIEGLDEAIEESDAKLKAADEALVAAEAAVRTLEPDEARARAVAEMPAAIVDTGEMRARLLSARERHKALLAEEKRAHIALLAAEEEARERAKLIGREWEEAADRLIAKAAEAREEPLPEVDRSACVPIEMDAAQCAQFISDASAKDAAAEAAYNAETDAMRREARRLHNELARASALMDDVERLTGEATSLERDVCAMCERPWDNASVALAAKRADLERLNSELARLREHQPRAKELDRQIAARRFEHDPTLAQLRAILAQLKEKLAVEDDRAWAAHEQAKAANERRARAFEAEAKAARAKAREESQSYLLGQENPVHSAKRRLEQAQAATRALDVERLRLEGDVRVADAKNEAADDAHRRALVALEEASLRLKSAREEFDRCKEAADREADYKTLLVGFRNRIFDETLAAIGAEASRILSELPNAQHITVDFVSERTTGRGTVQERIVPVTYLHGYKRPLKESVSGGQYTSVALAVDLATIRVISRRLGCNLDWLVLDESFNGHDTATKQACLEMLQRYAQDKLVIVVDHAAEVKDVFDRIVTVRMEGKHSTIC